MEEKEIGLYIHMPFWKQKCYYCDFVSYPNRYEMVERYIKCLKSEIVQYANENRIMHEHGLEPKFIIKTIYIGGGTPSSIDELYILNVIMLIGVKLFGKDVNGAKRWFSLGPLGTFQPSELSKVIMIIVVAAFLAKHQDDLNEPKVLGKLAVICGIPLLLILKQPSLSSTLDICFIILGMIFMAGLSSRLIVQVLIVGVPLLAIFLWYVQTPGQVLLEPHQVARIMSFLHPENYADSTALQTSNSIMAIGAGGLFGKGFGSNTISNVSASDVNLVSENQTDFIFSVIGEEFGFVGCVVLIIVFACLVYQCMNVAKKSGNLIGTYVAVGVACYMGFQSFINIAVATGTMPNTGQPLPFISYGLSSLMSASIAIGMVLNIYLQRKRH